jgi:hypothetical protein
MILRKHLITNSTKMDKESGKIESPKTPVQIRIKTCPNAPYKSRVINYSPVTAVRKLNF